MTTKAKNVKNKKASKTGISKIGFVVDYRGIGSTIVAKSWTGSKIAKNVFTTLVKAKKSLVTRLRNDVKKDLTRITKLSDKKGAKKPEKKTEQKPAPAAPAKKAATPKA